VLTVHLVIYINIRRCNSFSGYAEEDHKKKNLANSLSVSRGSNQLPVEYGQAECLLGSHTILSAMNMEAACLLVTLVKYDTQ
jgi:hypothetical protein